MATKQPDKPSSDTKAIKCKFCKADVRYDRVYGRIWEADKDELHSPNCPRSQAHYKQRGADTAQSRRG